MGTIVILQHRYFYLDDYDRHVFWWRPLNICTIISGWISYRKLNYRAHRRHFELWVSRRSQLREEGWNYPVCRNCLRILIWVRFGRIKLICVHNFVSHNAIFPELLSYMPLLSWSLCCKRSGRVCSFMALVVLWKNTQKFVSLCLFLGQKRQ